ncbi:MAG: GNAT family N-acetyltransferase [Candidatus Bipolaricaulis sp.]|nr:GNAT family N-acetyltransferase [Candidatus Bipolaricaulis sp.]
MRTVQRAFADGGDMAAMIALAVAFPNDNLHVVDLPYRLASWALDDPENVALWDDGRGRLAGWAVVQSPFWAIDIVTRPDADANLFPRALEWADARGRAARGTPHERASWYVHVLANQGRRLRDLEAAGFACQADGGEDSWTRILLRRTSVAPAAAAVPTGFAIRPLAGAAEVDAYVDAHRAAFDTKNMTSEWRRRTLAASHHVAEADLVAVAPDGRLAGFCVGWLLPGEPTVGQVEPLGVLWDYRELGLGAALLTECIRRLMACGATTVLVETDTYRTPALGLYESAGFEPMHDVLVYRKDAPNE